MAKRITYACVADNRKIEYEGGDIGPHKELVQNVLARAPLNVRKSLTTDKSDFTVNYIADSDRMWLCIAQEGLKTRIAFAYLENIRRQTPQSGTKKDRTIPSLLTSQMSQFNSDTDKISQVEAEIKAIKEVMVENINLVLQRGERVEDLYIRSEELREDALLFNKNATKLKSHFRWANLRWYLIGLVVLLLIGVGVAWGICGLTWKNCKKK